MTTRYPVLSAWLERVTTKAAHCVPITCTLGWSLTATGRPGEERTFLNLPMQGNAAELLRLLLIRASHLPIIGCVHDSFLLEGTIDKIEALVAELQEIMRKRPATCLASNYAPTANQMTSCVLPIVSRTNANVRTACGTGIG